VAGAAGKTFLAGTLKCRYKIGLGTQTASSEVIFGCFSQICDSGYIGLRFAHCAATYEN
jgi:hypothetical protein